MDSAVTSYVLEDVETRLNNLMMHAPDTPMHVDMGAMDIVGIATALGAGYGAHHVLKAGPVTGVTAIGTLGAGAGGIAAAAIAGVALGTLIGEVPAVSRYLDYATGIVMNPPPAGLGHLYVKPKFPDEFWKFDPGPGSTPSDVWWYVPQIGDRVAGTGDTVFRNPIEAVASAGIDHDRNDESSGGRKIAVVAIAMI